MKSLEAFEKLQMERLQRLLFHLRSRESQDW